MSNPAVCWQCGASLAELTPPISRFDSCRACHAALHVCKQCRWYDVSVAKHCREPIAEEERDKARANMCDYFSLRADAYRPAASGSAGRDALDALFGGSAKRVTNATPADSNDQARAALDALFAKKP